MEYMIVLIPTFVDDNLPPPLHTVVVGQTTKGIHIVAEADDNISVFYTVGSKGKILRQYQFCMAFTTSRAATTTFVKTAAPMLLKWFVSTHDNQSITDFINAAIDAGYTYLNGTAAFDISIDTALRETDVWGFNTQGWDVELDDDFEGYPEAEIAAEPDVDEASYSAFHDTLNALDYGDADEYI